MQKLTLFAASLIALAIGLAKRPEPRPAASVPRHVAIIGDSVARGAGDESRRGIGGYLPASVAVTNLGIDGAGTRTVLRHLTRSHVRAALRQADVVIVSIGGNDLFGDSRVRLLSTVAPRYAMWRADVRVRRVVAAIRRENRRARVYVLGLYNPYRAAWLDQHIARWDSRLIGSFAEWRGVAVIRIADLLEPPRMLSALDRFHPSAAGYRGIAERISAGW